MNLVTPKAEPKHELLFNKPASDAQVSLQTLLLVFLVSQQWHCEPNYSSYETDGLPLLLMFVLNAFLNKK